MEIVTAIRSKLGEYLVEPTIHQARYLFRFNSIVEDLEDEVTKLKLAQDRIKIKVEQAENYTEEVEKVVKKWLMDAENLIADVQRLEVQIQVKNSSLIGWCPNWGSRYWLSRKATKKTRYMLKLQFTAQQFTDDFSRRSYFKFFKATEKASDKLIVALKYERMVGLFGVGGVGKTTLATVVGYKLRQFRVFDEVVIAIVSQNPNIINVQSQLAKSLNFELNEVTKEERAKRLHLRFTETESKILVILDDVWKQYDLKNEFGIPVDDNHNGCKILITTRRKQVCDRMGCNSSITLGILEPEEGLDLLQMHAGIDGHDSTLIDVSKEVAGECKRLPLAIAAVGSALRGKDVDEWKLVSLKLKTAKLNDVDDVDVNVYACLKLSYDYLKDDNTKLCFLLCSLFPEDFKIDLEDLVRYGLGLGWYQSVETIEKARSLLHGMIKGLKDASLLLDTEEGFVKMHDIVRDVAVSIGSKEEKFFNGSGTGLTEWPEVEELKQCKAISLLGNKIKVLPNGLLCPNLHTLLLGNYEEFYYNGSRRLLVPDQFFKGMSVLKVATIIGGDLSLKSLQFLTNLEVLQLIRCVVRGIAFLGKLKRLQIMYLEWPSLDEIPNDLADELSKLRGDEYTITLPVLRELTLDSLPNLLTFCSECYFPTWQALQKLTLIRCSRLTAQHVGFQNLTEVEVIECNNLTYLFSFSQARSLVQLKRLLLLRCERLEHIIRVEFDDNEARENILGGDENKIALPMLKELTLDSLPNLTTFCSKRCFPTSQALQKLTLIRCPRLTDSADKFVQNLTESEELQILSVRSCYHLCDAILALLNYGLENLEDLSIADLGTQMVFQLQYMILYRRASRSFPCLKSLYLYRLREMEVIYKGPAHLFSLQNLTSLDVQGCDRLRYILTPTLARNLLQLEMLTIWHCCELKQIIDEDENDDDLPPVRFPKLRRISVRCCPKLKRLFHISVTPSLHELADLVIEDIDELEEVFWHKDGAVVMGDKEIVMTELKNLELKLLPNLTKCWPQGYQLTFPSLLSGTVENCLKYENDSENSVTKELQATSKGDASEERNTKENAAGTVGDASKMGDAK